MSTRDNGFRTVKSAEWHALVHAPSPFFSPEWEALLAGAFPYLSFEHRIYRDAFAVRLARIGGRFTTVPFSDGGDVIALSSAPLPLREFREDVLSRFGRSMTLRVHSHFCPVTDAGEIPADLIDFRISLREFDVSKVRKTLRHVLEEPLPSDASIRKAGSEDMQAAYRLYLSTMRDACALALPFPAFARIAEHGAFVLERGSTIRGVSVFVADGASVDYFLSASDVEGKHQNAPHHLLAHAIGYYKAASAATFFLGSTSTDSSLRTFKEGWRGEPCPIFTIADGSRHETIRRTPLRALWRFVPLPLLPKTSKIIGKHIL